MIYSVYDHSSRQYDYYETAATGPTHTPAPPKPVLRSAIGATPDQTAWPLPTGATKVGAGPSARGRIASLGDSDGIGGALPILAVGAAALYFLTR